MPRANTTTTVANAPSRRTEPVEGQTGGGLGQAGLAHRSERRQGEGDDDGAGPTGQRHHHVPRRAEHHELAPGQTQGRQRGVLLALHHALATERLAYDRQARQCGQTASTHQPTAWGWIDAATAVAVVSWF